MKVNKKTKTGWAIEAHRKYAAPTYCTAEPSYTEATCPAYACLQPLIIGLMFWAMTGMLLARDARLGRTVTAR